VDATSLMTLLSGLKLGQFEQPLCALGVELPADIGYLSDEDLARLDMNVVQRRKLLASVGGQRNVQDQKSVDGVSLAMKSEFGDCTSIKSADTEWETLLTEYLREEAGLNNSSLSQLDNMSLSAIASRETECIVASCQRRFAERFRSYCLCIEQEMPEKVQKKTTDKVYHNRVSHNGDVQRYPPHDSNVNESKLHESKLNESKIEISKISHVSSQPQMAPRVSSYGPNGPNLPVAVAWNSPEGLNTTWNPDSSQDVTYDDPRFQRKSPMTRPQMPSKSCKDNVKQLDTFRRPPPTPCRRRDKSKTSDNRQRGAKTVLAMLGGA